MTQATHGCGDLIFSSHTTFMLVGLLTYTEYGTRLPIKVRRCSACSSGTAFWVLHQPMFPGCRDSSSLDRTIGS